MFAIGVTLNLRKGERKRMTSKHCGAGDARQNPGNTAESNQCS